MSKWTTRRKVSFLVHLLYILVPAVAALVASVDLWTTLFGSPWFAIPLIVCLEGVAAVGFVFHLMKVDSPFVHARHLVPAYSLVTLSYELGAFLVARNGLALGLGTTAFVVAVFGTLFVKSFGVLERIFIDPIQAARERATEQAQGILLPLAVHNAQREVFHQFTAEFREAERLPEPRETLSFPDRPVQPVKDALFEELVESVKEGGAILRGELEPAARHSIGFYGERPAPYGTQPAVTASEVLSLDKLLADAGLSRERAREMVAQYGVASAADAYTKLRQFGYLPDGMTSEQFEPLFAELTQPAVVASEAPIACTCNLCDAPMSAGQKGVAAKWSKARGLLELLCGDCRKSYKPA
jgi:hypothetical protein